MLRASLKASLKSVWNIFIKCLNAQSLIELSIFLGNGKLQKLYIIIPDKNSVRKLTRVIIG